ncbi:MAG: hypothetical protein JWM34_716 [Ilumatobacteraceae bacterium]|nr:hypothetical protein [Ilumatobacteraceae bacterium]
MVRAWTAAAAGLVALAMTGCSGSAAPPIRDPPKLPPRQLLPTVVVTSTTVVPPAVPPDRVLLIGDSTLEGVLTYQAFGALRGFESTFDAQSCRTLGVPSCGEEPRPPNAVETIGAADGTFDTVVIMAGYDEWWTSFPTSFDAVVAAARAKGASRIVWLTYREGVGYTVPNGATANEAFVKNNVTLRAKVASGAFGDVVLADWFAYTEPTSGWLANDGIHLTKSGAFGVADYISREIAHLDGRACPAPWVAGGAIDEPCPDPDTHAAVDDIRSLYP